MAPGTRSPGPGSVGRTQLEESPARLRPGRRSGYRGGGCGSSTPIAARRRAACATSRAPRPASAPVSPSRRSSLRGPERAFLLGTLFHGGLDVERLRDLSRRGLDWAAIHLPGPIAWPRRHGPRRRPRRRRLGLGPRGGPGAARRRGGPHHRPERPLRQRRGAGPALPRRGGPGHARHQGGGLRARRARLPRRAPADRRGPPRRAGAGPGRAGGAPRGRASAARGTPSASTVGRSIVAPGETAQASPPVGPWSFTASGGAPPPASRRERRRRAGRLWSERRHLEGERRGDARPGRSARDPLRPRPRAATSPRRGSSRATSPTSTCCWRSAPRWSGRRRATGPPWAGPRSWSRRREGPWRGRACSAGVGRRWPWRRGGCSPRAWARRSPPAGRRSWTGSGPCACNGVSLPLPRPQLHGEAVRRRGAAGAAGALLPVAAHQRGVEGAHRALIPPAPRLSIFSR